MTPEDEELERIAQRQLAALKKATKATTEDAAVRAVHKVMAEYPDNFIDALKYDVAKRDSEFFTHSVEQPYDWSEWVCPDPKGYLMKCCDCGLVHEAQFGVVRYKSETEREDCDMVDDPNLQAVFRMRRSEQWSPADTAHRAGGLPMEQPAQPKERADYAKGFVDGFAECVKQTQPAQQQEPVAWMDGYRNIYSLEEKAAGCPEATIALVPMANHKKTSGSPINELQCVCGAVWLGEEMVHLPDKRPPASKPWVGLTDEEKMGICERLNAYNDDLIDAIEAKLREKNT